MSDTQQPELNLEDFRVEIERCLVCGNPGGAMPAVRESSYICRVCKRRYPDSLLKATLDNPFEYALKLRTGEVWHFIGAEIHGDFVHLEFEDPTFSHEHEWETPRDCLFCRGVDVNVNDIVWCADAPDGS